MNFSDLFFIKYAQEILERTLEHLFLVVISIGIATIVGIPLGILISRQQSLRQPILGIANVFQTIPSLALFGLLIPVPVIGGIGQNPAIVALSLYSLLPIIRNTYTGILAISVILAGVRVATVIAIGIATIAAAIGAGGLGELIFRGIAVVNNQLILAGAIPAAIVALLADLALGWLEKRLTVTSDQ
jgi:osmoprotectant transport system permease protein